MPRELLAAKRDNAQTLDLHRLARASAGSDVIDRGDVIEVSISAGLDEKDTIKLPVRVNDNGVANLPEIGPIPLAGMEMEAAEATIVAACIERKLYRNPNVTVTMKHQRTNRVMVMGAVKKPDVYELPRGRSDLLAAITAAGGLDKDAGTKVEIRNPKLPSGMRPDPVASGGPPGVETVGHSSDGSADPASTIPGEPQRSSEIVRIDLVVATKAGTGGYLVDDGGVVSIEKRDPEPLHVLGRVKKPDRYEFPIAEEVRVTDAVAKAGGTDPNFCDKVYVIRRKPGSSETVVIQISLKEAKHNADANLRLEPGDAVSVESTPLTIVYDFFQIFRFNMGASLPTAGLY